jgi:hypothetical protein
MDPNAPITSEEQIREIGRQVMRELSAEEQTPTPPAAEEPKSGPPAGADPIKASDLTIAVDVLTQQLGSREAALEHLALGPGSTGVMTEAIRNRRAELQEAADAEALAQWQSTAEGRRYAATTALEQKQETAKLVTASRALLEETPGFDADLVGRLSDDEVLEAAGVLDHEPAAPVLPERSEHDLEVAALKRQWFQLADFERREKAAELGISYDEIAEEKATDPSPNIWS